MAHTAPPETPPRRKLEIALGVFVLLVGAALFAVTLVALNHPKGRPAASATDSSPARTSAGASSRASSSASKAPTSTKPTTSATSGSGSSGSASPGSGSSGVASTPNASTSAAGIAKLPLVVLNNSSSTTATVAAQRFQAGGWTVSDVSTFSGDILSTAVYYDPDDPGAQAAANALQLQFPAIHRVKPKFDGLPSGPLVVVLTSDYS